MELTAIWRHPIKAIGREALDRVHLTPGRGLPFDRHWAVTHTDSQPIDGWARKVNFLRGVSGPGLMAVTATLDEATRHITLHHPDQGSITLDPAGACGAFLAWITAIWPEGLPQPTGIVAHEAGFTDIPDPWIAVNNHVSHRAVEQKLGRSLSPHRWRGNLWLDGMAPWEEFDLVDRMFRIGDTLLCGKSRITRCRATEANPETGKRDADTLGTLRTWGHQDFGIYAEVLEGGEIAPGAKVEIL